MLRSLKITGFRAFSQFEMKSLTRVNLLVGANNSGKTCLLEAVEVLCGGGSWWVLTHGPARRGERRETPDPSSSEAHLAEMVNVLHLFQGHPRTGNPTFRIEEPKGEGAPERFVEATLKNLQDVLLSGSGGHTVPRRPLEVKSNGRVGTLILTPEGGQFPTSVPEDVAVRTRFVSSARATEEIRNQWGEIELTPKELQIEDFLRVVDDRIEHVRPRSASSFGPDFKVLLNGSAEPVPLGSLGDGVRTLLAIGTNLVTSAGGVLLVDDIDTGLHHSTMTKMWKLVIETARKLDVQVFATTHSLDCLRALHWACREQPDLVQEIAVHRIVRGKGEAVTYHAPEFLTAIDHEYEIR
jgi:hypothetical protein